MIINGDVVSAVRTNIGGSGKLAKTLFDGMLDILQNTSDIC